MFCKKLDTIYFIARSTKNFSSKINFARSKKGFTEVLNSPLSKYITLAANDCGYDGTAEELIVQYVHPLFLRAHSAASKEDNPGWREATRGKFADDYWKAMEVEIFTLESIDAWDVVEREDHMNIFNSTWAFKCKRYLDGLIKKFKARLCAQGDQQLQGIDFSRPMRQLCNGRRFT